MALPLRDIRVVELGHLIAGPTAAMVLADMGADVIKIEPLEGESMRHSQGNAGSIYFFNRNKRGLAMDLRTESGREIFLALVARSDVVIENYGPGALERLDLGYERLLKINPRLILCSVKGFLPGPYYHRRSMDEIAQMMGGLAYMTGVPGKPQRAGTSVSDSTSGLFGVVGVLAALHERELTGKGQHLTVGLYEAVVFLIGQYIATYQVTGQRPLPLPAYPMGPRFRWAIYDLFECSDGKGVFIGIPTDRDWQNFTEAFGMDELRNDARLQTMDGRIAARDWLIPNVEQTLANFTSADVMERLDRLKIPFGPFNTPADLLEDPQMLVDGRLLDVQDTEGGRTLSLPNLPFESTAYQKTIVREPPRTGEHTAEVLRELGYTEAAIQELVEQRIVNAPLPGQT
jgi:crotonobetainyl-CoA:carnitine CoA-transferase CaiB-like acyl-CoA transferase